jgi:aryl-alcohol dehydrogenase-like predicted oxidoreductase
MFHIESYRELSGTGIKISPVTLGTMTFGDQNTQEQAFEQLNYAKSVGINSIDVAELYPVPPKANTYTMTETIVGNWLKTIERKSVVLSTKIAGPRRKLDWIRGGPLAIDSENINAALDSSLKRLQTDYVDILYLHWPERNVPMFGQYQFEPDLEYHQDGQKIKWISIEEQLEALSKIVKAGKARAIALSNEQPWGIMEFLRIAREKGLPLIAGVQNNYSMLNRVAELGLTEIIYREKLGFLSYSPLAFGHLTGKYIKNNQAVGRVNLFPGYAQRYNKPGVMPAVIEYLRLAEDNNLSLTQMALAFVYSRWFVTSTIIGATSLAQLQENINAFPTTLSKEIFEKIEQIHLMNMNPAP